MYQVYAFHGTEMQVVYDNLNNFLSELHIIDVQVAPENIRSNTKYYPDWDRTATTIEVCIDFSASPAPHEIADQVRELHHVIVYGKPEPAPAQEEKPVTVPASDDFDPFIDSDNLP